eukprot:CAMPEP_0197545810 /NCGR_PEP_ID=MMETSP1320-20131121/701_1 /TAXON_ID=91990 /ORGANISM="Bolidomonas sp., Strain RCC2347" /LENGTH=606 /DNA_ID=CAMNT_0043105347 /DNA_START=13 /DNA_END=1833 /DNA_ORIENTATION=+
MASNPPEVVKITAADGTQIPISSLWKDRKVVLIFLRQLGCRFCRQQVSEIMDFSLKRKLAQHDVVLCLISLGNVEQVKEWLEVTGYDGELYIDESTDGNPMTSPSTPGSLPYAVFRLRRGAEYLRLDDPDAQKKSEAVYARFPDMEQLGEKAGDGTVTIWPGDVFQTGGAFVLGPGNLCDFAFRSTYAGDHVDLDTIFKYAIGSDPTSGEELLYESTDNWFKKMKNDRRLTISPMGNIVAAGGLVSFSNSVLRAISSRTSVALGLGVAAGLASSAVSRKVNGGSGRRTGVLSALFGLSVSSLYLAQKTIMNAYIHSKLKYIDASMEVKLLTPIEIDDKVLESGLPECDCGATMATMPMLGMREPGDVVAQKNVISRSRSQTWVSDISGSNEFQTILCYVREFLAKPHPAVGRGGPVCPFVPTSLKKNSIYMSVVRTNGIKGLIEDVKEREKQIRKVLAKLLRDFVPIFEGLEPSKGKLRQFKAIILIFPDIKANQAHDIIDAVQVLVKESFVEKGLMCGEFHETNNASGLRNPNFFPLRTPYPCLAIRHMVPGDIAFMTLDDYPVKMRVKLLKGFLDVFGEEDKPQVKEAKEKLAAAELELLGQEK